MLICVVNEIKRIPQNSSSVVRPLSELNVKDSKFVKCTSFRVSAGSIVKETRN